MRHLAGNSRPDDVSRLPAPVSAAKTTTKRPITLPPVPAPVDSDDIVRTPAHVIAPSRATQKDLPSAAKVSGIGGASELRRAPRVRRKSHAQLLLFPAGRHPHPIDVTVVDYSATGIGIVHTEGLLVGQKFIVREPHVTEGKTCLYTVVRSEARSDGTFSIGMHIGNSLSDEHDRMLAVPPAPGITLGSKLLFLVFAVLGAVTVLLVTLLKYWYPHR